MNDDCFYRVVNRKGEPFIIHHSSFITNNN